jgi:hypothetical protein
MVFVLLVMFMGPMMRMMFGTMHNRWDRLDGPRGKRAQRALDEALAERDQVIDDLQRRLTEMESRLDFTERMLAERSTTSAG